MGKRVTKTQCWEEYQTLGSIFCDRSINSIRPLKETFEQQGPPTNWIKLPQDPPQGLHNHTAMAPHTDWAVKAIIYSRFDPQPQGAEIESARHALIWEHLIAQGARWFATLKITFRLGSYWSIRWALPCGTAAQANSPTIALVMLSGVEGFLRTGASGHFSKTGTSVLASVKHEWDFAIGELLADQRAVFTRQVDVENCCRKVLGGCVCQSVFDIVGRNNARTLPPQQVGDVETNERFVLGYEDRSPIKASHRASLATPS